MLVGLASTTQLLPAPKTAKDTAESESAVSRIDM